MVAQLRSNCKRERMYLCTSSIYVALITMVTLLSDRGLGGGRGIQEKKSGPLCLHPVGIISEEGHLKSHSVITARSIHTKQ